MFMKKKLNGILPFAVSLILISNVNAQEQPKDSIIYEEPVFTEEESNEVEDTYISTRIINTHSVETLKKGTLEFRIEHRFGDVSGGSHTIGDFQSSLNELFGLDNATDIRFGFEYGITNKLMAGLGRSRGNSTAYKSVLDGFLKYRILHQQKKGMPISLTALATMSYSYQKAGTDLSSFNSYTKQIDRLAFAYQLNFAKKFADKVTIAIMPTVVYRNSVNYNDQNLLPSLGAAATYFLNKRTSLSVEYFHNFQKSGTRTGYYNSMAVSVDWMTFGHNFKVFFANSMCFGETQFIAFNTTNFNQGGYRIGFCLGRKYMKE